MFVLQHGGTRKSCGPDNLIVAFPKPGGAGGDTSCIVSDCGGRWPCVDVSFSGNRCYSVAGDFFALLGNPPLNASALPTFARNSLYSLGGNFSVAGGKSFAEWQKAGFGVGSTLARLPTTTQAITDAARDTLGLA